MTQQQRRDDPTQLRSREAEPEAAVPRVALRDVVLALPPEQQPSPVTQRFMPGETVSIVGGNASGKTLLLKTILGLVPPRAGRVRVETADIYEDSARAVQAALFRVGFVLPEGMLLGATNVYDNVALQLRYFGHHDEATIEDHVLHWLERLDLLDVASARPAALTVHQVRRVALARALVHDPCVLLLDEPFGQLDADSSVRILDVLTEWKATADRTVLITTVGSARVRHLADRMLIIERGELRTMHEGRDPLLDTQGAQALKSRVAIERTDRPAEHITQPPAGPPNAINAAAERDPGDSKADDHFPVAPADHRQASASSEFAAARSLDDAADLSTAATAHDATIAPHNERAANAADPPPLDDTTDHAADTGRSEDTALSRGQGDFLDKPADDPDAPKQ